MKKNYQKPAMCVVQLQHRCQILAGSEVHSLGGNSNMRYAGSDDDYEEGIIR